MNAETVDNAKRWSMVSFFSTFQLPSFPDRTNDRFNFPVSDSAESVAFIFSLLRARKKPERSRKVRSNSSSNFRACDLSIIICLYSIVVCTNSYGEFSLFRRFVRFTIYYIDRTIELNWSVNTLSRPIETYRLLSTRAQSHPLSGLVVSTVYFRMR